MKQIKLLIIGILMLFVFLKPALAIRFDVKEAMQEEWDRYEAYKEDYIKFHDLENYEDYVSEYDLRASFGFKNPREYAIPQDVWNAKYNPPLQGSAYYTTNRGNAASLTHQPSAVALYASKNENGVLHGYVKSTYGDTYLDHPYIYGGTHGYITTNSGYVGSDCGSRSRDCINCGYYGAGTHYARVATNQGNGFYTVDYY